MSHEEERGVVLLSTIIFTAVILWLIAVFLRFGERTLFATKNQLVQLRALELHSEELTRYGSAIDAGRHHVTATQGEGVGAILISRDSSEHQIPSWKKLVAGAEEIHCPVGRCIVSELELVGDLVIHGDLTVDGPVRIVLPSVLTVFGRVEMGSIEVAADGMVLSPCEITVSEVSQSPESTAMLLIHSGSTIVIERSPNWIGSGLTLSALERLSLAGTDFPTPTGPIPDFASSYFTPRSVRGAVLGELINR